MSDNTKENNREEQRESHPLQPFLPSGAKLLMCGTFPPKRVRWSMEFYYPNFINDMWRIFGLVYFDDKDHFVDAANKTFKLNELKPFLIERGIALSDTGREVIREKDNAADKHLNILKHIDLADILAQLPQCHAVATTGEKAAAVVAGITGTEVPKTGEYADCSLMLSDGTVREFRHWRMPSSSRAYPLKLDKKAEAYGRMLRSLESQEK